MPPKSKSSSSSGNLEEQFSDPDAGITRSSPHQSPNKNKNRSPVKRLYNNHVPKEPWQLQLEALTVQVSTLSQSVSQLLKQQAPLIQAKSGKSKFSPAIISNSIQIDKGEQSELSSQEGSEDSKENSSQSTSVFRSARTTEEAKLQASLSRSYATFNLSFMKGVYLTFIGLMDDFYSGGIMLFMPDGKVYSYAPIKKEDNRMTLVCDGNRDPSHASPQQRLICAFPTNLPDFITFGSLIKNMVSYGTVGSHSFLDSESVRANTAGEISEAFTYYHEKFLFTENIDKFNQLTNFAVCMHYFIISWNFAIINGNLQLIWSQESKELWNSMKGHYVKDSAYFVPEYPVNDILHLLGSYCPSCLRRGNCVMFCESCFAKKSVKDKSNASISQWSDLNLLQHKISLNGSRKGLNRSMGLSTF